MLLVGSPPFPLLADTTSNYALCATQTLRLKLCFARWDCALCPGVAGLESLQALPREMPRRTNSLVRV